MPQDAFTLRYLCIELNNIFSGGKINRIVQTDENRVVFTVYTGKTTKKLMLDVNPANPRIGVVDEEGDSPLVAPNFCMLLRKHLLSANIDGISLVGFDRIVKIDLTPSSELFDAVPKVLFVELMGRYSNVILTENFKILGGNRGVNTLGDFVRPLIVGKPYVLPPVQDKKLPSDLRLIEYFSIHDDDYAKRICSGVQGVALDTAKEIVYSYGKDISVNPKDFFEYFNDFIYNSELKPCVVYNENGVKDVFAFRYKSVHGEYKYFDSLTVAEEYYFAEKNKLKRYNNLKDRLKSVTNTALKKARKRLQAITAKEKDAESLEDNKIKGELIIANIYKIKRGDECVELDNYYDGTKIKIALDTNLTPAENAENYYKKYNKQKRALQAIAPQKEQAESEVNYLTGVLDEVELCETETELKSVREELRSYGLIPQDKVKKNKKTDGSFCKVYFIDGFTVKVGRSNTENDELTATARAESVWLHAKNYHSAHVIIEYNGKTVPENVIIKSAEITAYYSNGRDGGKCEVAYTQKRNVKKPPRSKPGFVTYTDYRSVVVEPKNNLEFLKTE